VNFGGAVLPGNRVAPATGQTPRFGDIGAGNVPYWVVTTRTSARTASLALGTTSGPAPVRVTNVRSAQSGP
jgi:hypothetical protein